jgi:hypothetical protein
MKGRLLNLAAGVPLHASPRSSSDDHERRHRECYVYREASSAPFVERKRTTH